MTKPYDTFRPRTEPARTLYDVFQDEAKNRSKRIPSCWIEQERQAVWLAARDYAQQHGLRVPTIEEIKQFETSAMGHVDYGAKWAHRVAELLRRTTA